MSAETVPLLADTSAWKQARRPEVSARWQKLVRSDRIVTTPIVVFELLMGARGGEQFDTLETLIDSLTSVPLTERAVEVARETMRKLAQIQPTYHRVKTPDLLIAAAAHEAGVGVLHYDAHFDRIAEVLELETHWIAPAGSFE